MRTKRDPETKEQRAARLEQEASARRQDADTEDKRIEALVQQSITLHGP